jgi:hypothetical protein
MNCDSLVVFIDESSPSKRLLSFLEKACTSAFEIRDYREYIYDILMLEGGSSLLPLIWNKKNNKIIVGCPLRYEGFLEKLREILE